MMKRYLYILIALMIMGTLLGGCSPTQGMETQNLKQEEPATEPIGESGESVNPIDPKYISDEETIYELIDGDREFLLHLTEDYPDFAEIKAVSEEFSSLWYGPDYRTHQGDEWFYLYSKAAYANALKEDEAKESRDFANKYKIVGSHQSTEILKIELLDIVYDKAMVTAKVVTFLEDSASQYGKDYNCEIGQNASYTATYRLIKEDGFWKVDAAGSVNNQLEQQ